MKSQEQKAVEILRALADFLGSMDVPSQERGLVVPRERSVTITDDMGFGQSTIVVNQAAMTHAHFGVGVSGESEDQTFNRWVDQFHELVCGSDYLRKSQCLSEEIAFDKEVQAGQQGLVVVERA